MANARWDGYTGPMTALDIKRRLSENPFFSGLADEFIDFLAEHAAVRRLETGEILFAQGQAASRFFMLSSGRVSVEVPAIEGPTLELQSLGPGAVIGWSWLIPPYRWTFQARAMEPLEVIECHGEAVLAHCEENPRFGYELLKRFSGLMSERLHFARQKMMEEWQPPGYA